MGLSETRGLTLGFLAESQNSYDESFLPRNSTSWDSSEFNRSLRNL